MRKRYILDWYKSGKSCCVGKLLLASLPDLSERSASVRVDQ